jgi:D-alanyl-D-alanine carboxypeptidase/D-alanyl-D-alanine-endopeptidase (penicillin-binding protein 4)
VAYVDPVSYSVRAVEGMWRAMGGKLSGKVREGKAAPDLKPSFEFASPALAEVIRDINKYSNNVMAQQVFLTLGRQAGNRSITASGVGTMAAARDVVQTWWEERIAHGEAGAALDLPVLDNGSGLSRDGRISAQALALLLQTAYRSPLMSELMSSLPINGVDGTLRRSLSKSSGSAHLKTGSLRGVSAVAGFVDAASGHRYVLVAIINHANASAAHPAIDALIDWTIKDQ